MPTSGKAIPTAVAIELVELEDDHCKRTPIGLFILAIRNKLEISS